MSDNNINNEKPTSQRGAIKHFWKYTGIFFASALVLIIIAGAIQTYNLQEYMDNNELEASANQSALQSVKEINDTLTKQLNDTKVELATLKNEHDSTLEAYKSMETKLDQMLIIMDAQEIYISGGRRTAREKLKEIDKEELHEDLISAYNNIYEKLY